mmetsp:Transcript_73475/g.123820  ORF Transcript_73475/g.123820 Transcript_73475/m.123820 type:complete len:235 (-) Transcript_73475:250-954(-)
MVLRDLIKLVLGVDVTAKADDVEHKLFPLAAVRLETLSSHVERSVPVLILDVNVRILLHKVPQQVVEAAAGAVVQGPIAFVVCGLDVSPFTMQKLYEIDAVHLCGCMQACLALIVGGVHLGPMFNHTICHPDVAVVGALVQNGVAIGVLGIDVHAVFAQQIEALDAPAGGGGVQGGAPDVVVVVDVGLGIDEDLHGAPEVLLHCQVQRRLAEFVGAVGVSVEGRQAVLEGCGVL